MKLFAHSIAFQCSFFALHSAQTNQENCTIALLENQEVSATTHSFAEKHGRVGFFGLNGKA
ncbi:MAG: hypothetical protein CYG59_08170 [Chloroflexi bacterium]|nr:MAG: hypothetical protein CYG59_08170 [Chloroflexota bacterium]